MLALCAPRKPAPMLARGAPDYDDASDPLHFSWAGVAASAAGAGAGQAVGSVLGDSLGRDAAGQFATRAISGFVAGATTSLARGGRVEAAQVATDAFGQSLSSALVGQTSQGSQQEERAYDYSDAPDQSVAETARLNGYQARAAQANSERQQQNFRVFEIQQQNRAGNSAEDFRASERDYRSSSERSVAGHGYMAQSGDSITRILGTGNAQDVGNFMRANGLNNSALRAGQNYFVPDDTSAYGDSGALGQRTLSIDNARLDSIAQQRAAQSRAAAAAANGVFGVGASLDLVNRLALPGSFEAMATAPASQFEETQSWKVGLGGAIVGNLGYAGPGASQVPMAAAGAVNSNVFALAKEGLLNASADAVVWGGRQGNALGMAASVAGYAGLTAGELLPDNSAGFAASVAAGPVVGRGLSAGVAGLNSLAARSSLTSWAAADLTPLAGRAAQAVGSAFDDALFSYQDRLGLVLRAVPDGVGNVERSVDGFIADVHGALGTKLNSAELAEFRALDPTAKIGLTGSSATGRVGNPNKPTFGQPINVDKFDLDLFVQSDVLLEQFGTRLKAAPILRQELVDDFPPCSKV